jgi:DedD protein
VLPVDATPDSTKNAGSGAARPVTNTPLATVETPPRPAEMPQPTEPVSTTPVPATPPKTETPAKPETSKVASNAPGRAASGRFYVHLGVYTVTKNADDLVASLKQGGMPAFTEASEAQGKAASRVRVGPYEDRAAAEAVRLRIKQMNPTVSSSVVQLADDAKADTPPTALPANRAGGWAVQLGAFKTVDEANKVRDRLKTAGFVAYVDKVDAESGTLWRVRAGPEADRGNADKLKGRIREKLKMDGMVVTQQ